MKQMYTSYIHEHTSTSTCIYLHIFVCVTCWKAGIWKNIHAILFQKGDVCTCGSGDWQDNNSLFKQLPCHSRPRNPRAGAVGGGEDRGWIGLDEQGQDDGSLVTELAFFVYNGSDWKTYRYVRKILTPDSF